MSDTDDKYCCATDWDREKPTISIKFCPFCGVDIIRNDSMRVT